VRYLAKKTATFFWLAHFDFFPKIGLEKKKSQPRANGTNYRKSLLMGLA